MTKLLMIKFFSKNAYLVAVAKQFENDEQKFFQSIQSASLKYEYTNVNYQNFCVNYQAGNWIGRKFLAIPAVFYCGVIKPIYHLAQVLLVKLSKNFISNQKCLQVSTYYVIRDLTAAAGWITTLFNDKFGQYVAQKNDFHTDCYNFSIKNGSLLVKLVEKYKQINLLPRAKKAQALPKLANAYLISGKPEDALYLIQKEGVNHTTKIFFIIKLAEYYLAKQKHDKAMKTIDLVRDETGEFYGQAFKLNA